MLARLDVPVRSALSFASNADPDEVARLVGLADQARGHVVAIRTGRPSAKAGKRHNG